MPTIYSTYEAKARFSEILRKIRSGESVYVTYRGETVAEIKPYEKRETVEEQLKSLEARGIITPRKEPRGPLRPIAKRPGALKRFLESRD